jgi:CRISPR-associated protein Cmr6
MRDVLHALQRVPDHVGLAYGPWAPTAEDGKVPDNNRPRWFEKLVGLKVPDHYRQAFQTWEGSFRSDSDQLFELALTSRLLLGHGNASAAEVGLTVHHTWGVPVITGSALKGLCAHYTATMHGPDAPETAPWRLTGEAAERARYQGVRWDGTTIKAGPGDVYRALFGAPDGDEDETWHKHGGNDWPAGAARGGVVFHDALYVPGSAAVGGKDRPFVQDVLTVHQKKYYDAAGQPAQPWPNDYDDPNPVAFLTVHPSTHFLVAVSGDAKETALAAHILKEALQEWGVGGKTSLGYGRGTLGAWRRPGA